MTFGIIHYMYLIDSILMLLCLILVVRRYAEQRNPLTLLFTIFLSSFTFLCIGYFARGIFLVNSLGSMTVYRLTMVATVFVPALLITFIFYPLILDKGKAKIISSSSLITIIIWLASIISVVMVILGEVSLSFTVESFDVYSITFGTITYGLIVLTPIIAGLFSVVMFAIMAFRETEKFYKIRATLLLIGWLLIMLGQITLLSQSLMIMNPILFGAGIMIMAIAILRKSA